MKKRYRSLVLLLAGALLAGLSAGPGLAADTGEAALSKDGTLQTQSNTKSQPRSTQVQRKAAADRAKAKGFVAPGVGTAAPTPVTHPQATGGSQ